MINILVYVAIEETSCRADKANAYCTDSGLHLIGEKIWCVNNEKVVGVNQPSSRFAL